MLSPPPLVLLPGLQSDHRSWEHQIRHFRDHREVFVPRGHQSCDSIEAMADVVVAQLPARMHLVAWSMGGYIALAMLPHIADRLVSLTLMDTSARPEEPGSTARRLDLIDSARREGLEAASLKSMTYSCRNIGAVDPSALKGVTQSWVDLGLDAYQNQQRAIISRPDGRRNLALIASPTMIVVGDSDRVTPPNCAEELHRAIPGSVLHVLPDCGHCPPLELPDLVNHLLDQWLLRCE